MGANRIEIDETGIIKTRLFSILFQTPRVYEGSGRSIQRL